MWAINTVFIDLKLEYMFIFYFKKTLVRGMKNLHPKRCEWLQLYRKHEHMKKRHENANHFLFHLTLIFRPHYYIFRLYAHY